MYIHIWNDTVQTFYILVLSLNLQSKVLFLCQYIRTDHICLKSCILFQHEAEIRSVEPILYENVYHFFASQTRLRWTFLHSSLAYLSESIQSVKRQLQADGLLFKRHSIIFVGLDSTSSLLRFWKQRQYIAMKKWVRRKRKDNRWEEIFANHISNMGLVSRTYTDSCVSTTKK